MQNITDYFFIVLPYLFVLVVQKHVEVRAGFRFPTYDETERAKISSEKWVVILMGNMKTIRFSSIVIAFVSIFVIQSANDMTFVYCGVGLMIVVVVTMSLLVNWRSFVI